MTDVIEHLRRTLDKYVDGAATPLEVVEAAEAWRHSDDASSFAASWRPKPPAPPEDFAQLHVGRDESGVLTYTTTAGVDNTIEDIVSMLLQGIEAQIVGQAVRDVTARYPHMADEIVADLAAAEARMMLMDMVVHMPTSAASA